MSCVSASDNINDTCTTDDNNNDLNIPNTDNIINDESKITYITDYIKVTNIKDIKLVIDAPYNGTLETYIDNDLNNKRDFYTSDEFNLIDSPSREKGRYSAWLTFDFGPRDSTLDSVFMLEDSTLYIRFFNPTKAPEDNYKYHFMLPIEIDRKESIKIENMSYNFFNRTLIAQFRIDDILKNEFNESYIITDYREIRIEIENEHESSRRTIGCHFVNNTYILEEEYYFWGGIYNVTVTNLKYNTTYTTFLKIESPKITFNETHFTNNFTVTFKFGISHYKNGTDLIITLFNETIIPVTTDFEMHEISFKNLPPDFYYVNFYCEGDEYCDSLNETIEIEIDKEEPIMDIDLPVINNNTIELNIYIGAGILNEFSVKIKDEEKIIKINGAKKYKVIFDNLESGDYEAEITYFENEFYNELILTYDFRIIGDKVEEIYNKTDYDELVNESEDDSDLDNESDEDIDENDTLDEYDNIGDEYENNETGNETNNITPTIINKTKILKQVFNYKNNYQNFERSINNDAKKDEINSKYTSVGKSQEKLSYKKSPKSYELSKTPTKSIKGNKNKLVTLIVVLLISLVAIFIYSKFHKKDNNEY